MQAWHDLSKYKSATAVSNSIILNLQKKSQINLKKLHQDRNHKCIQVR
jgi:BarA-like signal transduction histidine kinase